MLPTPSIVLEWETGLDCSQQRISRCLAQIALQLEMLQGRFSRPAETIICFDPAEASGEDIRAALAAIHPLAGWPGVLSLLEEAGLDYYQKKNAGFARCSGDVVVFLDSDLVPEEGWLEAMLQPFADSRKSVVMGLTHLDTHSLYQRAVALFWIFPAREPQAGLRAGAPLVSNNIAFRSPLFARMPFPVRPTHRGQCSELNRMLDAVGIVLHQNTAARASHPAPPGVRGFVARAIMAGADQCYYDKLTGRAGWRKCLEQWRIDRAQVAQRIAGRREGVGADRSDVLAAYVLGGLFYTVKALSYLARLRGKERSEGASVAS